MIRHLPFLDSERWYVIDVDHGKRSGRPPWQERVVSLHGPRTEASVSWSLLGKHGFGLGVQFGRNGGESDVGLNVYLGRLASFWLRLRAPWTSWARVGQESGDRYWYEARHTGIRIHPHSGCLIDFELDAHDNAGASSVPRWRRWSITKTTIMGRRRIDRVDGESGVARIPMPEGVYLGTWTEAVTTSRYVRAPGTWRDRILGPRRHRYVDLKVEGGIPVEGKGENSWDCGMDGIFGTGGATKEEAIANMVRAVLRGRESYGGPHDLDRPMTVSEAEKRHA